MTEAVEAALLDLSGLSDPARARAPGARDAIVRTIRQLRRCLVHAEKWPTPAQIAGVAYCAVANDRAIIADEQGLGKTGIALMRVLLCGYRRVLVACPKSLLLNWEDETLGKRVAGRREGGWIPNMPVRVLRTTRTAPPPPGWSGLVVTTWDLLRAHAEALAAWCPRLVVGDEAHAVLNDEAQRSEAFAAVHRVAAHVLLLTGTPIKNRSSELLRLLRIVAPADWPETEEIDEAFKKIDKAALDAVMSEAQGAWVVRRIRRHLLRRLKQEALADLPAKAFHLLWVDLPPRARARYDAIDKQFDLFVRRDARRRLAAEGLEGDELEEAIAAAVTKAKGAEGLVKMGKLRRLLGEMKVPLAVEWAAAAARIGEPVVVFCEHAPVVAGVARGVAAQGLRCAVIDGKTSATARHRAVKQFQEGLINVLVASQAAKEGLTLTRAKHVLMVEPWWTGAAEDQAIDRLHRLTQTREVQVWRMLARRTVDERVAAITARKRRITHRAVGT